MISPLAAILNYGSNISGVFGAARVMGFGRIASGVAAIALNLNPLKLTLTAVGAFAAYVAASPSRIEAMATAFAPVTAAIDVTWQALQLTGTYISQALTPVMNAIGFTGETAFGWVTQAIQGVGVATLMAVGGFQIMGVRAEGVAKKVTAAWDLMAGSMKDIFGILSSFSAVEMMANPGAVFDALKNAGTAPLRAYHKQIAAIDTDTERSVTMITQSLEKALDDAYLWAATGSTRAKPNASARTQPVAQTNVTNIHGGVRIIQEFKDNAEPDRIAFGIKDMFNQIARNPTSIKGGTRMGLT